MLFCNPVGLGGYKRTGFNAPFLLYWVISLNLDVESGNEMEEIILVAGEDKACVGRLRRRLREHGYHSIPCRSAEQVVDEMRILGTCGACVPLVVLDPNVLRNADDVLVRRLGDCAPHVPILLAGEPDDLTEVFERICEYRTQFRREQNPALADVLESTGVRIPCC